MINNINKLKLCFEIKLLDESSMELSIIHIDPLIHNAQNAVFFICKNGFTFEKSYNTLKYTIFRLTIPPYLKEETLKFNYTFVNNQSRYVFLKEFKKNLEEFTNSGFFGKNFNSKVVLCDNTWFVY